MNVEQKKLFSQNANQHWANLENLLREYQI